MSITTRLVFHAWHPRWRDVSPSFPAAGIARLRIKNPVRVRSHPGRSLCLDTAFRSPAAKSCLAASPRSRVNAPGLYLRHYAGTSAGPFGFALPALPGVFLPGRRDHCTSPVANLRSRHLPFAVAPPLPSRTSRSFGICALCPTTSGKACLHESPDLLSLPVALQ
jgi:hypothetical protein